MCTCHCLPRLRKVLVAWIMQTSASTYICMHATALPYNCSSTRQSNANSSNQLLMQSSPSCCTVVTTIIIILHFVWGPPQAGHATCCCLPIWSSPILGILGLPDFDSERLEGSPLSSLSSPVLISPLLSNIMQMLFDVRYVFLFEEPVAPRSLVVLLSLSTLCWLWGCGPCGVPSLSAPRHYPSHKHLTTICP